jgi:putative transposase
MRQPILSFGKHLASWVKQILKQWTKPATAALVIDTLSDMIRNRTELIAENALLRQQLIVLKRQVKQPQFTQGDRIQLVLLARCTRFWHQALHLVQPDTLLRWHRDLFRFYWRRKSRTTSREPRIAQENRLWGAERIRGELLKLGIKVSKRTIQKYMPKTRPTSSGSQTWSTFLKNHAKDIWACDFTVVHDLLFRPLYIFVIIELQTRRIVHLAVTRSPTDEWTRQQLREATPWSSGPKYLIHDRDNKHGPLFSALAESSGIKLLRTPVRTPRANAIYDPYHQAQSSPSRC